MNNELSSDVGRHWHTKGERERWTMSKGSAGETAVKVIASRANYTGITKAYLELEFWLRRGETE